MSKSEICTRSKPGFVRSRDREGEEMKHTPEPWKWTRVSSIGLTIDTLQGADRKVIFIDHDREGYPCLEVSKMDKALIAAAPDGLKAAELAYLHILKTPIDTLRIGKEGQSALCALRDFIASSTGRDIEEVQNEFEQKSLEGR